MFGKRSTKSAYRAPKVLVSHATADKPKLVKLGLFQGLLAEHLEVYVDNRSNLEGLRFNSVLRKIKDIKLDSQWRRELANMLDNVDVLIVCWSNAYLRKANPIAGEEDSGIWVRDELQPAYHAGRAIHVFLEKLDSLPPPFQTVLKDTQTSTLWDKLTHDTRRSEYEKMANAAQEKLSRIIRDEQEMDPEFDAEFALVHPFLDRVLQEMPFGDPSTDIDTCGALLVRGAKHDNLFALRDRYVRFTLPTRNKLEKKPLNWATIRRDAFEGKLKLQEWTEIFVPGCFSRATSDQALDCLAQIMVQNGPAAGNGAGADRLVAVVESLKQTPKRDKEKYLVYLEISPETWKLKQVLVTEVIDKLTKAIAPLRVTWLKFLIVFEAPPNARGLTGRGKARGFGDPFLAAPTGRTPDDPLQPALWHRLDDLSEVTPHDCDAWSELVAKRWRTDVVGAKAAVRREVGDATRSFADTEPLLREALRGLWPEVRDPRISSRDKARRS